MNNDTVVTTGWLRRLLEALYSDPKIGLAGPCSNCVGGPQQVAVRYDSLAELDGFAWDWGRDHHGLRIDINRLVGFCLLIRREVIDAVGLFDERFGIGCFEDDDYTLRAIRAGFRAVIAGDAFVHHYGGRTFAGIGVDYNSLLHENHQRFLAKWAAGGSAAPAENASAGPNGDSTVIPARKWPGPFAADVAPGGGLRLRIDQERPRLSLCMIVRDSARTLPACLESIRPWVDEMVIVDTGSVDDTPRIVESFGGRLFHFPWCDDFSAARNESLRHGRGDWLFWMDSDDTIPADCGRKLRGLIERDIDPRVLGFVMQVHCPGGRDEGGPEFNVTVVDHVKLFRNRPDLRFDGRIHEQLLPAIRRAAGEVAWTDIYVVHSGSDQSSAAQDKKLQRDLRLLELELAERPEHPFTLFNLGMTHVHGARYAEAADYLRRGIARSSPEESHLRKAYALLVYAEMRLGRREQALETCRRGRGLFPRDIELRFREGVLLHEMGRFAEAKRSYLDVLGNGDDRHFSSVDRGLNGFKAHQNLAVVTTEMGDLAEAERHWREVVREAPGYRPGWRGLAETLIGRGLFADADAVAEELVRNGPHHVEGLIIKSRIAVAQGRFEEARVELDRAIAAGPGDLETLRARCRFFFEHGTPAEAEAALKCLIAQEPQDASAYHNLGTLLLRTARYDEAVQAFRQSLRFRLNHPATYVSLGYALKDSGRMEEAVGAWEQALRLAPNDPTARSELMRHGRGAVRPEAASRRTTRLGPSQTGFVPAIVDASSGSN